MSEPKDLERSLGAALDSFVANRIAPLQQELKKELAHAAKGATSAGAAVSVGSDALTSAYYRIASAKSQTDILQKFLDATASFAARSALLVVKGDRLSGWRARGFDGGAGERLRELNISADGDAGWRRALADQAAATGVIELAPKQLREVFFEHVGAPDDKRGYLLPLMVRERPVAAVYADVGSRAGTLDLAAIDLLARVTGLWLEVSAIRQRAGAPTATAATTAAAAAAVPPAASDVIEVPPAAEPIAAPPPPPRAAVSAAPAAAAPKVPGPDLDRIPATDHDIHKKAYRSAKLLVDDLISYHKGKIEQGRSERDIYSKIREDFDKSRAYYQKKWKDTPAGSVDYFHQEVIRRLALDDPGNMGGDYPGPLA